MVEPKIRMMFETPLIEADLAEIDAMHVELREAVTARGLGSSASPEALWGEEEDLSAWAPGVAAPLARAAIELVSRCTLDTGSPEHTRFTWRASLRPLILPSGAGLPLADRPAVDWTIYYSVDPQKAGESSGGLLLLQDPRMPTLHMVAPDLRFVIPARNDVEQPIRTVAPIAGRMMMIPGWLRSGISAYSGPGKQLWVIADLRAEARAPGRRI